MKKNTVIVASVFTAAIFSQSVMANDTGTLTFSGAITDQACTVPTEQMTRQIDMAAISPEILAAADENESVGESAFTFNVTGCPAALTSVGIQVEFTPDGTNDQYLNNTGTATGVAYGITDKNNALKKTREIINATDYSSTAGTATVEAKVRAYRVGSATPVTGTIASTATVTLITN